jgi:catechol 2,3-dioxygenase-like lactoylglutathione lyase family enzyme
MNETTVTVEVPNTEVTLASVRLFLAHYTLYVEDLARSVRFYTSALPLRVGHRPPFPGPEGAWLYTADGDDVIHLNSQGPPPPKQVSIDDMGWRVSFADRAIDHIAFSVDDFDAAVARIRQCGVPHRLDAIPEFGYRQVFLRDPDGVGIEINDSRGRPLARPAP